MTLHFLQVFYVRIQQSAQEIHTLLGAGLFLAVTTDPNN